MPFLNYNERQSIMILGLKFLRTLQCLTYNINFTYIILPTLIENQI